MRCSNCAMGGQIERNTDGKNSVPGRNRRIDVFIDTSQCRKSREFRTLRAWGR